MAIKLGKKGWLGLTWPKKYGGGQRPMMDTVVFEEELAYYGQPGWNRPGVGMLGPTVLAFGTEEQKQEYVPGIVSGNVFWCHGFSEPDAGSDLASVQTLAVEEGDFFVVNGQKVWSSFAQHAEWIFFLARTDREAQRHRGISFFVIPIRTQGITVRAIDYMAGSSCFAEVFFDNVKVPKQNIIGEKNRGWNVAMGTLGFERSGIEYVGINHRVLDELVAYSKQTVINGRSLSSQQLVRNQLAEMAIEVEISRMLSYNIAWMQSLNKDVDTEASMAKLWGSELMHRLASTGMYLLGLYGQLEPDSKLAQLMGRVQREYMHSMGWITSSGSSEIQRNVIAWRGLGMPRER
jgi:alkylation response protein AidB-like acyl-CoA dehydrogenase